MSKKVKLSQDPRKDQPADGAYVKAVYLSDIQQDGTTNVARIEYGVIDSAGAELAVQLTMPLDGPAFAAFVAAAGKPDLFSDLQELALAFLIDQGELSGTVE